MKYYVYVSDTKLDMLYDQVPQPFWKKLSVELGINWGFVNVSLKERKDDLKSQQAARYEKLKLVTNYIKNNFPVGSIESPNEYFQGSLAMRWGSYMKSGMVFFAGKTDNTWVGLAGSEYHVIGGFGRSEGYPSRSFLPYIEMAMKEEIGHEPVEPTGDRYLSAKKEWIRDYSTGGRLRAKDEKQSFQRMVIKVATQMEGPEEKFEFLAKKLTYGSLPLPGKYLSDRVLYGLGGYYSSDKKRPYRREDKVLFGTPLYVSYSR